MIYFVKYVHKITTFPILCTYWISPQVKLLNAVRIHDRIHLIDLDASAMFTDETLKNSKTSSGTTLE